MVISQKCQYALRAIFELAKSSRGEPLKIGAIAEAQAIPPRFLEVILSELKQAGFVESRRGAAGGYWLVPPPVGLNVADVIEFIEGPIAPVACVRSDSDDQCPLRGECVFLPMWKRVQDAMTGVYRTTSFQDLVDEDLRTHHQYVPMYSI